MRSRKGRQGTKRCHSRESVSVPRAALAPCFLGNMLANNTSPSILAQTTNLGLFDKEEWIWTCNLFSKRMNLSFSISKIIKREKERAEKNSVCVGWRCGLCFWLHMHQHLLASSLYSRWSVMMWQQTPSTLRGLKQQKFVSHSSHMSTEGCVMFCCTLALEWSPAYWHRTTRPRGVTIGRHILPAKANLMATPNFHHLKEISSIQKRVRILHQFLSYMKFW